MRESLVRVQSCWHWEFVPPAASISLFLVCLPTQYRVWSVRIKAIVVKNRGLNRTTSTFLKLWRSTRALQVLFRDRTSKSRSWQFSSSCDSFRFHQIQFGDASDENNETCTISDQAIPHAKLIRLGKHVLKKMARHSRRSCRSFRSRTESSII